MLQALPTTSHKLYERLFESWRRSNLTCVVLRGVFVTHRVEWCQHILTEFCAFFEDGLCRVSACIGDHRAFEVPYRSVYRSLNRAEFSFVDPDSAYLGTVVDQGQPLNFSYQTAVKSGAPDAGTETPPDGSYNCPI